MIHQVRGSQTRHKADHKRQPRRPIGPVPVERARAANVAQLQRAVQDLHRARPADILALQRAAGNRAVCA